MEFLGIGPVELLFILIIALLVLGPNEMVKAIRTVGRVMREVVTSEWWASTKKTIQDVRKLPYDLMREAGMEEDLKALDEIREATSGALKTPPKGSTQKKATPDLSAWTKPSLSEDPGNPEPGGTPGGLPGGLPEGNPEGEPEIILPESQPFDLNPKENEQTILPPHLESEMDSHSPEAEQDHTENKGEKQD